METQTIPMPKTNKPEAVADWSIVARCGYNDVPVKIVKKSKREDALIAAKDITAEEIILMAAGVFDIEVKPHEIACLSLVKYSAHGEPVSCETVELGE